MSIGLTPAEIESAPQPPTPSPVIGAPRAPAAGDRLRPRRPQSDRPNATWLWLLVIAATSLFLHTWELGQPREAIFDECHFVGFATAYSSTGVRFFDVHPPTGKLLIAAGAHLAGYDGDARLNRPGSSYGRANPAALRWLPSILSASIPILVFLLLRALGAGLSASAFGAVMVLLENALLTQTRAALLDGVLVTGALAAVWASLRGVRAAGPARWAWTLLAGFAAGVAISTKVTGGAAWVLACCIALAPWIRGRSSSNAIRAIAMCAVISATVAGVYAVSWALHWSLLDRPGRGDRFVEPTGHFVADTIAMNRAMLERNASVTRPHRDGSRWYQWPLGRRPIYYWHSDTARIYFLPNPIVWIGATVMLLFMLVASLLSRGSALAIPSVPPEKRPYRWVPVAGLIVAFLPLALVGRVLFLYHYLLPMIFAVIAVTLWLERIGWLRDAPLGHQRKSVYGVAVLAAACFVFLAPITFGKPAPWFDALPPYMTFWHE